MKEKKRSTEIFIPNGGLVQGEHYYINEQGLWVFTAKYLLLRGYCCDNGCKHCPYKQDQGQ